MGAWVLRKRCGCALIVIKDGSIYKDANLAKLLTILIEQSPLAVNHLDTVENMVMHDEPCLHETTQKRLPGLDGERPTWQTARNLNASDNAIAAAITAAFAKNDNPPDHETGELVAMAMRDEAAA